MKSVKKLQDEKVANCDVFCLVRNRETGQGWYCGSTTYVSNLTSGKPICQYSSASFKNEFGKEKLTNTNTFGIPEAIPAEGAVQPSPEKTIRQAQLRMLQQLPLNQGPSTSLQGHVTSAFTTKKTKVFLINLQHLVHLSY